MQENNTLNIQKNTHKSIWLLIVSMLLMGMGLYAMFNPETALMASAMMLGFIFIIMGCGYLMEYRRTRTYKHIILSITNIIIGALLIINLNMTTISMPFIFGLWCLFVGIVQLIEGLQLRSHQLPLSGLTILVGLLGMLFGILVFLNPLFGMFTISFLLGAYLIIYGAFEMSLYYQG